MMAEEDKGFSRFTWHGTHRGERGMVIDRVVAGKTVEGEGGNRVSGMTQLTPSCAKIG
jgi:hypothetical protein